MKPLKDPHEKEHCYGSKVHLLNDPWLETELARVCSPETTQPTLNLLLESIYSSLLRIVVNSEFPLKPTQIRTRMAELHPEGVFETRLLDPSQKAVSVNLARAGTLPSHTCYHALNTLLDPKQVRQDHISIARQTDSAHQVTGSAVSGHKIGGSVEGSILLIPDPMGATGSTVDQTLKLYEAYGKPLKTIAIHCIVTPEYLKLMHDRHPELVIYAIRLDRGLSPREVLDTLPGTHWERERGLNANQYIVPGGGGFGEILNNAYV
jgi:uracil phosphoribosyltransferase